ncbi:MAG: DUF2286 domain-containing protein [Sulfolobales archaeon]|nr:DUF2286 domain-containing protein [Sulfolobales archaeon]
MPTNGKKTLILSVEGGNIVDSKVVEAELEETIKKTLIELLPKWSPKTSDLIAMKYEHEVTLKLPLSKELYEILSKYGLSKKSSSEATATLPVYVISYENRWVGEDLVDDKVYVITPYINEEIKKEVELLAADLTTPPSESEEE